MLGTANCDLGILKKLSMMISQVSQNEKVRKYCTYNKDGVCMKRQILSKLLKLNLPKT
jgi:hypothetical protein